jgi:RNA polymerase sigma-70 factor (ECF subfamily)
LKRIFFFKSLKIDDQEKKISIPEINHPGVILENKESVNAIFNGINKLPSKLKTVIILLKIEGKSQKETAKIMQLSVKAIESLFHRAKKKLAVILKDNEI